MSMTALAAGMLMAAYFLLLYAGVGLIQEKRFFGSAPKEVFDAVPARKKERFRGARLLGWFVALLRFCCSPGRSFSLHGTGCGTGSGSGDSLCGFWRCFTSWSCTTSAFLTGYCSAIRTSFRIFIRR